MGYIIKVSGKGDMGRKFFLTKAPLVCIMLFVSLCGVEVYENQSQ